MAWRAFGLCYQPTCCLAQHVYLWPAAWHRAQAKRQAKEVFNAAAAKRSRPTSAGSTGHRATWTPEEPPSSAGKCIPAGTSSVRPPDITLPPCRHPLEVRQNSILCRHAGAYWHMCCQVLRASDCHACTPDTPSTSASSCLRRSEGCRHGFHALGPALQDSALSRARAAQSSWQPECRSAVCQLCRKPVPCHTGCSTCLHHSLSCLSAAHMFGSTRAALAAGDGRDLQTDPATLDRVTKAMLSQSKAVLLTNADRREAR